MNEVFSKTLYVVLEKKNTKKSFKNVLSFHEAGKSLSILLYRTFFLGKELSVNLKRMEELVKSYEEGPPKKRGKYFPSMDSKKLNLTSLPVSQFISNMG